MPLNVKFGEEIQRQNVDEDRFVPPRQAQHRVLLAKADGRGGIDKIRVLVNPTTVRIRQAVDWTRLAVVGLPYEPSQYNRTRNIEFSMQFYFSAVEAAVRGYDLDGFEQLRFFFESLLYPRRPGGSPPLVAVIWPNVFAFRAACESQSEDFTQFGTAGHPEIFTIDVDFFEVQGLRYADEVAKSGRLTAGRIGRAELFAASNFDNVIPSTGA